MANYEWGKEIKFNFSKAAHKYKNYSYVQKYFSKQIVSIISELEIPKGEWLDLGAGPGILSDLIEDKFSRKNVFRVDFSKDMLDENRLGSKTILWDLNKGFPTTIQNCSLIVSNFCIHWLKDPEKKLKLWFHHLNQKGYMIVTFPTNHSFPEWRNTCKKTHIEYGGITFPELTHTLKSFSNKEIYSSNIYTYKEFFPDIYKLFRNIINVGANTSRTARKTVKELKMMQHSWPKLENHQVSLTWEICICIIRKI
tara:strand:- start:960 stop:1718 length:759 start_codon:yes stop_codon:yes gene_type:complete